ncbi:MAG: SDR family NAD(P)-dependent oxidoreductase [Pseudomonadota bacterium]
MIRGSLIDKATVVTGGGYGLGKAIAEALARPGATVLIAGRDGQRLIESADELRL